jgi:multiple sugar transport system substrate-binding protein
MSQDLRMTIWSANQAHLDLLNEIAANYEKDHPGVHISYDSLGWEDYPTTVTTQIAGGNAPDLAWIVDSSAPDFMAAGALYPLDETFKTTEGYDIADFPPATLEAWSKDGQQFLFPFSTSPFGIFVNNDMIRAAGAKTPAELITEGKWTWESAIDIAAQVAAGGEKQGLINRDFNFRVWSNLASIYTGWGAKPFSDDMKSCAFTSSEMKDAMSFIHDAIFAKHAMPAPGVNADFFAGDGAMTITQISRASLLPTGADAFDWDLVPLPAGPVGEYSWVGRAGIAVLAASAHPKEAADFLAFFSNKENVEKLSQFFPPARKSVLSVETVAKANPLLNAEQIENVVIRGVETGQSAQPMPNFAQIQQVVRAALDELWLPDADVDQVMDNVCARLNPVLASN